MKWFDLRLRQLERVLRIVAIIFNLILTVLGIQDLRSGNYAAAGISGLLILLLTVCIAMLNTIERDRRRTAALSPPQGLQ